MELAATNESDPNAVKYFYSGRNAVNNPTIRIDYDHLPSTSTPVSPADGTVLTTATPLLTATVATDPDAGDPISYWFRATPVSTAEDGAKMVDSGIVSTPSYTVPRGALTDGVTYYWHVLTSDGVVWRGADTTIKFRVDLRLGAKDPFPRDQVGPASVNLSNGNLVVGTSSPTLPAAGGSAGLSYTYNSQGAVNLGLSGSYYDDDGSHSTAGKVPRMVRTDPTPDFYWGTTGPGGGLPPDRYLVHWSGTLTVPTPVGTVKGSTASYTFTADHDDGVKVTVGTNVVINRWSDGAVQNPSDIAAPITLVRGTPVPFSVDYYQSGGSAFVGVAVSGPNGPNGATTYTQVLPSWLTPDRAVTGGALPPGWTVGPTGLPYVGAALGDRWVSLTGTSGAAHTYSWRPGSGYAPPPEEDGVLAPDAAGGVLTMHGDDGMNYVFDVAGRLQYATDAVDDVAQSSLQYVFSTDPSRPVRLVSVKDPAANRQMSLLYGGRDACPTTPPQAGLTTAPIDMLCQVKYWDGTSTNLWYSSTDANLAQLTRVDDPGGSVTEFVYAAAGGGLLTGVLTPLAWDATHSTPPAASYGDNARTLITYDTAPTPRVASVTMPEPTPGAARPGHTYEYPQNQNQTLVHVAGMTGSTNEPAGFARRVTNTQDLATAKFTVADTDATSRTTTTVLDAGSRVLSSTDNGGNRSTTAYDGDAGAGGRAQPSGRATDTYGPAKASCFTGDVPNATCTDPKPAHTATTYDTDASGAPLTGLAATFWANSVLAGQPAQHPTVVPAPDGTLVSADPAGLSPAGWSGRYLGELIVPTTGAYHFALALTGSGRLFVDDTLVVDAWQSHPQVATVAATSPSLSAGRHRVRVDYAPQATQSGPQLQLRWAPAGQTDAALAAASLAPRYSNPTRTVADDSTNIAQRVTTTDYDTPANRLVKTQTQDPGTPPTHLNLVNSVTYGDASQLHRPVSATLPAGPATAVSYAYYGLGEAPPTTGCAGAGQNQGRMPKSTTGATPDGPLGPIVTQSVYDEAGRTLATRVASDPRWTCLVYDARGRLTSRFMPGSLPGTTDRSVTSAYAVGGNPLVTSMADPAGTIVTTVDLLGRIVRYEDVSHNVTVSTYDQAGRLVTASGPAGRIDTDFDVAGRPTAQHLADPGSLLVGPIVATAVYDAAGRLDSSAYPTGLGNAGNGTSLATSTDDTGGTRQLGWSTPTGALATDSVRRSQSARVVDETVDGTDARPSGDNFTYDAVGRLVQAWVPGHTLDYSFGPTGGCGSLTTAGADTNRTAVSDNNGPATTSCYDAADRLSSSSDPAVGTVGYDAHGNTTTIGTQTLAYDQSNRHAGTTATATPPVSYVRDATDRITSRTEGASTTFRYGFAGPGDSPSVVTDAAGTVTQRVIGLLGGATLTKGPATAIPNVPVGDVWAYPNLHGDVMAIADASGAKQGATFTYDPFGQGTVPDDAASNFDYGWLGQHQRPTEHAGASSLIEMGARPYSPATGRFLSVDPVEGGSANDYEYANGDPVNGLDLTGLKASCRNNSSLCNRYRSLSGNVARGVYFGFSAGQISRLRSLVKAGALPSNGLNWSTDSCSGMGKVSNGVMLGSFGNSCGKHDFGYRNHAAIFGRTSEDDRKTIDNQLRRDTQDTCTQFGVVATGRSGICYIDAEATYRAVRQFGEQYY